MFFNVNLRPFLVGLIAATAILHGAGPIRAQVTEVVVGITPHCPYGFPGCWAGAKGALENLDDMLIVASTPDIFKAHPAFRGVGVTSSSISAPSSALPRFRTL